MEYGVEIETIGYDSIRTDSAEMGHGDGMRLSVFAIVFTRTAQPKNREDIFMWLACFPTYGLSPGK